MEGLDEGPFKKEPILEIILRAENTRGKRTPLASLYQIEAYIDNTRTDDQLACSLHGVPDALDNGIANSGDAIVPSLTGKGMHTQNKGALDVFNFKYEVVKYLAGDYADAHAWSTETKSSLRKLTTHVGDRELFGKTGVQRDLLWLGSLP